VFWDNFWPNFWSDIIAGAFIGGLFGWFIARRLSALERFEQERDLEITKRERAIQYLTLIRKEIQDLIKRLPGELVKFTETGWGREIRIDTPFWNSIDRSGELPRLLHPSMVLFLTQFYGDLAYARRGLEFLLQSWLVPSPSTVPGMEEKQRAFMQMTESSLRRAIQRAPSMLDHVKDNIEVLEEQLRVLRE